MNSLSSLHHIGMVDAKNRGFKPIEKLASYARITHNKRKCNLYYFLAIKIKNQNNITYIRFYLTLITRMFRGATALYIKIKGT